MAAPDQLAALAEKAKSDPYIAKQILEETYRAKARISLLDFAKRVYPDYETPPHIVYLAGLLEDMEAGRGKRNICISIPVRHGKSVLSSQIFPAWYLGRHPRHKIVLASHSADLAVLNSRAAKGIVEGEEWPWPDILMSKDSAAVGNWNLVKGGGMYAVGVGGAITGRGANLLIVDDALDDGLSEANRQSAWAWWQEKATPRTEPKAIKIVIGARFASDDLPGRIEDDEQDSKNWTLYSLPGIAVADDLIGRKPGEALWPTRWPIEELEKKRLSMSPRAFEAQVQQNPLPEGGHLFNSDWFTETYDKQPERVIINRDFFGNITGGSKLFVGQAIDSAWKDGPSNDYSVIATWGMDDVWYYLLDVWRARVLLPILIEAVKQQAEIWKPDLIVVEDKQSGTGVIQTVRMQTRLPIVGVVPMDSKETRAERVLGPFMAHKVKLPKYAPWLHAWVKEHLEFPGSANKKDDQVDTTSLMLGQMMIRSIQRQNGYRKSDVAERYMGWMNR